MEAFLLKKYSKYERISGGEIYFPLHIRKMFVEECTSLKVAILGLEFFYVKSGLVIPVEPMNILDSSEMLKMYPHWDDVVNHCNQAALRVLIEEEKRDPTQYYNPLLVEKSGS